MGLLKPIPEPSVPRLKVSSSAGGRIRTCLEYFGFGAHIPLAAKQNEQVQAAVSIRLLLVRVDLVGWIPVMWYSSENLMP